MYDAATEQLIRGVPHLTGLDTANLPRYLTRVYADLAVARITLADSASRPVLPPGLLDDLERLKRMAAALETVACLPHTPNADRASSAFVAATCYQLLHQAAVLAGGRAGQPDTAGTFLDANAISPDIAATLLFQIAGAFPDAMAVAKRMEVLPPTTSAARLIVAIRSLALDLATDAAQPYQEPLASGVPDLDLDAQLIDGFWRTLLEGVRSLAASIAGSVPDVQARPLFELVRTLAARDVSARTFVTDVRRVPPVVLDIFGGPHHLASLLIAADDVLRRHGLAAVPAPPSCDPTDWHTTTAHLARYRPFLWPNHLDAISHGFLAPGKSAAISFPTGAGKSTLVQLKIASALLSGKRVIFLVPTHALVDQTVKDLGRAFPDHRVAGVLSEATAGFSGESGSASDIAVTTPESCLASLGESNLSIGAIGLVVFDECHLLHPQQGIEDRRSLDAMLCLLQLLDDIPAADFVLLSAMMANATELAGWLRDFHARDCLALNLGWKPTRQARGCLVYDSQRIRELAQLLTAGRQASKTKAPPSALKRKLTARPFALFSLRHAWTMDDGDYAFICLLATDVPLGGSLNAFNLEWQLTANRNEVSALLAASLCHSRLKTLVLVQDVRYVASVAKAIARHLEGSMASSTLTGTEKALLDAAIAEIGSVDGVTHPASGLVAQHHGLLLAEERRLSESLFQRHAGAACLVASPTLAMGINLPAEAVVIAGDDRFDRTTERMEQLAAHELLNAAGRAGRAGSSSQGIVVVVPGKVVSVDWKRTEVGPRWMNLQSVFSQSDQCLRILDPIDLWLDRLQQGAVQPSDLARTRYFLARLPDAPPDEADSGRPLARSLGAYYAKKQGQTPAYQDRVRLAYRQRSEFIKRTDVAWHADVARWAGVEPTLIGILDDAIGAAEVFADWTVPEWLDWWLLWLSTHIEVSSVLHRADERRDELAHLVGDTDAHQRLLRLTSAWMRGETLEMLQTQLGTSSKKGLPCEGARKFVLRMLPDVSFGARLLGRVYRSKFVDRSHLPASLEALPGCIAHGFALPEELALHYLSGAKSRLQVKVAYIELRPHLLAVADRAVSFADVRDRVKGALRRFGRDPV